MAERKTGTWATVRLEADNYMEASEAYTTKSEELEQMRLSLIQPRQRLVRLNEEIERLREAVRESESYVGYFQVQLDQAIIARDAIRIRIQEFERAENELNELSGRRTAARNLLWKALDALNRKIVVKLKQMADIVALREFRVRGGDPIRFSIAKSTGCPNALEVQRKLRQQLTEAGISDLRVVDVYEINRSGNITRV